MSTTRMIFHANNTDYLYFLCVSLLQLWSQYVDAISAVSGSRVELPCHIDMPLTNETILKRQAFILLINPVTPADSGSYRCTVVVNGKTHSREIELNVLVPPKIVKAPASTIKLVEGDTLQLSCVAEGNPRPTVTWLIQPFNRNLLPFLGRAMFPAKRVLEQLESTFIEMNGYLQVSHLDRKLSGLLACQAVNGVEPRAVREMLLDVRFPPEIDMLNPLIKQSLTRDTVLQCTANANPLGNIVWSYGVDRRRINASTCSILTDKKEKYCIIESRPRPEEPFSVLVSKLHVFNLAEEDFGEYFCSMSTMMGRGSAKTLLEHYVPPFENSIRIFKYNVQQYQRSKETNLMTTQEVSEPTSTPSGNSPRPAAFAYDARTKEQRTSSGAGRPNWSTLVFTTVYLQLGLIDR